MNSRYDSGLLNSAQALFQSEAWEKLANLLAPLLRSPSQSPLWALQYGGAAAFHLNRLAEAESLLHKAFQVNPAEGWVSYFLGRLKLKQGVLDQAITYLRRSVQSLPQERWPLFFLLDALLRQGDCISSQPLISRLLPYKAQLSGFDRLYHLWLSQSLRLAEPLPPHGLILLSIHLNDGNWLLLGWSSAENLEIDQSGRIEACVTPQVQSNIAQRFPISDGYGWIFQWSGYPPRAGWSLHGYTQDPQILDLTKLSWPCSALTLIQSLHQFGLAEQAWSSCLNSWLGDALTKLVPTRPSAPCLPLGSRVIQISDKVIDSPTVSIVLPLSHRWQRIRAHLMLLSHEPLVRSGNVELIIVLDDPSVSEELIQWLSRFASVFEVPIRLVLHPASMGLSQAWTSGSLQALGDSLLLLQSDVFPQKPGWLTKLEGELRRDEKIVLVSPLIIDPCGALMMGELVKSNQDHNGLFKVSVSGKGFHREGSEQSSLMSLFSAGVWMLDRKRFVELGCLSSWLIDESDSGLYFSIRLQQAGFMALLVPAVQFVQGSHPQIYPKQSSVAPSSDSSVESFVKVVNQWLALRLPNLTSCAS